MKKEGSFSSSLILNSIVNEADENNFSEQNNDLAIDTKINNFSFNNNENKNQDMQNNICANNNNKEQGEQTELNNFNIEFFLPKDLKENLEVGEECISDNELNFKNEENSSLQNTNLNNFNSFDNQFNNYSNFGLNNKELINKNIFKQNHNPNDIQINNKEFLSSLQDNPQINNNFINNYNNPNELNDNCNLNKNIYENKISNGFNDISNPTNFLMNQEKEPQMNIAFDNNQNNYFPQNNRNLLWGNQFPNNQLFYNNNNYINPINQINFNFNQIQPPSNDLPFFDFQNKFNNNNFDSTQNEFKKRKKKIIDDYTIEMFGRRGWICELCNNFNYETRKKCNRCHINKKPKKINTYLLSEKNKNINHKNDWHCPSCGNFNYSFRIICNRCQKKKEE